MTASTLAPVAYSVNQVAELLPLTPNTIYKRIADKSIPARKIGSRLLIPRSWVEEQFATPAEAAS